MKAKFVYLFLFGIFSLSKLSGQDPLFSQFYANPLYLGPSFAGAIDGSRIAGQYRNQWFDLGAKFVTYSLSYDHYISDFNSGIGVNFLSDVAGTSKLGTIQAGLHYSYNVKLFNVWRLRPGLSFSFIQYGIYGNMRYMDEVLHGDQGFTSAPVQALEATRDIDAGTSLLIYTKGFWIGGTVDHLLKPNVSLHATNSVIPLKTTIYGGKDFHARGKLLKPSNDKLTFAFLYKQQDEVRQLDLGAYWYTHPFIFGAWYRGIPTISSHRGEAIAFIVGIKTESFNVGYSYDLTISNLLKHTKGSHEISFSYKFLIQKRDKKGAVPCPEL